jgi:hypothetical protein
VSGLACGIFRGTWDARFLNLNMDLKTNNFALDKERGYSFSMPQVKFGYLSQVGILFFGICETVKEEGVDSAVN